MRRRNGRCRERVLRIAIGVRTCFLALVLKEMRKGNVCFVDLTDYALDGGSALVKRSARPIVCAAA